MLTIILSFLLSISNIVSFECSVHDFGELERDNSTHNCVFKMKNVSNEDVEIVMTRTSCDCTKVTRWTKGRIPPGKYAYIFIEYSAESFSTENIERDIYIYLKGSDKPEKVQITGHYKDN